MKLGEIKSFLELTEIVENINPRDVLKELYFNYMELKVKHDELNNHYDELKVLYQRQSETLHQQQHYIKKLKGDNE